MLQKSQYRFSLCQNCSKKLIGLPNWAEKNNLIVAKARFDLFSLKNQLVEQKFVLLCHFQHLLDN